MSRRFSLFNAGFAANMPSLFFGMEVLYCDHLSETSNGGSLSELLEPEKLQMVRGSAAGYLKSATELADYFGIKAPAQPQSPGEYFAWQEEYIRKFEEMFPMNRIDYYYFFYSRKLAEIACNMGICKTCMEITSKSNGASDLSRKVLMRLKDSDFILFRMIAATALLSGENGHNYFNRLYMELKEKFDKFSINEDVLASDRLELIADDAGEFQAHVLQGFNRCSDILKTLSI